MTNEYFSMKRNCDNIFNPLSHVGSVSFAICSRMTHNATFKMPAMADNRILKNIQHVECFTAHHQP